MKGKEKEDKRFPDDGRRSPSHFFFNLVSVALDICAAG
jgi:hypothetical protein